MIGFSLTEEQTELQKLAREFAAKEIAPKAAYHDETGEFPWDILRKGWDIGLMNTHVPEEYGGLGLGVLDGCLIAEEIAAACSGIGTAMEANQLAAAPVIVGGSDEQKKKWLSGLTEEFRLAAYAVTEPGAGSDVAGLSTTARKVGNEYVINGSKMWITCAGVADWYFVIALTNPARGARGMSAFIEIGRAHV
jgi:acyl-CoA dehydrogenase